MQYKKECIYLVEKQEYTKKKLIAIYTLTAGDCEVAENQMTSRQSVVPIAPDC